MGFNYGAEKRRFDAAWSKLEKEYRATEFDEAGIEAMREYDWADFCKRRSYENREQELPADAIDDDDDGGNSTLIKKFSALSCPFDESGALTGRYDWIENIENPVLAEKLKNLSDADKELLTLLAFDDLTQAEIGALQGCSHQAVNKRIQRLKKYLQ